MTWLIGGNSNVTTTSFLGTINPQPLVIKTNNKEAMRVASADGDVSIGDQGATRSPDYKLDVQGILNADDIYKGGARLVGSQWEDVTDDGISYGAGNVGIGELGAARSPDYKLDVQGILNADDIYKGGARLVGSQWEDVTDDGISYGAGNVGIGELGAARDPDYKLDVQGILNADDIYKDGARLVGSQWEDVTDDGISYGAGNVGIGELGAARDPDYKLDVQGILNADDIYKDGARLVGSQWEDVTDDGISYGAGNVGIGELGAARDPDYKLDVQGILNADDIYKDGARLVGSQWEDVTDDGISYGAGNVGIGELGAARDPDYKLDVQGILNADDIYKDGARLVGSQWEDVTDDGISYGAGNVGIGKAPAANYKLDVAGTINATDIHKNGAPLSVSQWEDVAGGITYRGAGVGIGKAPSRSYKLDVAGTINATDLHKNGSPLVTSQWADDSSLGLGISYTAGRVAIGTTADRPRLTVGQTEVSSDESAIGIGAYAEGGGETIGIVAWADGAGSVFAGLFKGDVLVQGNLETPGGKSFLIDHPLDPQNKTLRHNSVESPENLCLYRGKVKLGPNGSDTVQLPNYFAALINEEEATAYLTPVGEEPFPTSYKWNGAHTELTIFGREGAEVAYLVLADRDDRTMQLFSRPVEEEKGGSNFERGKLLSPEAFDLPLERGVAPLPRQEEQTIRAEPTPPRAVPPEPIAPEMPAEDKGEGSD